MCETCERANKKNYHYWYMRWREDDIASGKRRMTPAQDLYDLISNGFAAEQIMNIMRMKPSRFRQILRSKYVQDRLTAGLELSGMIASCNCARHLGSAVNDLMDVAGKTGSEDVKTRLRAALGMLRAAGGLLGKGLVPRAAAALIGEEVRSAEAAAGIADLQIGDPGQTRPAALPHKKGQMLFPDFPGISASVQKDAETCRAKPGKTRERARNTGVSRETWLEKLAAQKNVAQPPPAVQGQVHVAQPPSAVQSAALALRVVANSAATAPNIATAAGANIAPAVRRRVPVTSQRDELAHGHKDPRLTPGAIDATPRLAPGTTSVEGTVRTAEGTQTVPPGTLLASKQCHPEKHSRGRLCHMQKNVVANTATTAPGLFNTSPLGEVGPQGRVRVMAAPRAHTLTLPSPFEGEGFGTAPIWRSAFPAYRKALTTAASRAERSG